MTSDDNASSNTARDQGLKRGSPAWFAYRRVLRLALWINLLMFGIEIAGAARADSVALLGDAIDFFGDAANYGISLAVMGGVLSLRARTAMLKAAFMAAFGVFVLWQGIANLEAGVVPEARTMAGIGVLALFANLVVTRMLYRFRHGDANMRSVWLSTRNDALSNLAILAAALGVFGSGSGLPDVAVGLIMAGLALSSAWSVWRHARRELVRGD